MTFAENANELTPPAIGIYRKHTFLRSFCVSNLTTGFPSLGAAILNNENLLEMRLDK